MAVETKSQKVEKFIRRRITENNWSPGDRLPSDKDLSGELGVSYMTVKTVMSHLSNEGLLVRRKRRGTFVAGTAASCIALMTRAENLSSPNGYYYRAMLDTARKEIAARDMRPVLTVGHGDKDEDFLDSLHFFDSPAAKQTVGAVIFGCPHDVLRDECRVHGIPSVDIRAGIAVEGQCSVVMDYKSLCRFGISKLESLGYSNYHIYQVEAPSDRTDLSFYRQYRKLIESEFADCKGAIRWLPWVGWDYEGIYDEFKRVWAEEEHPDAIFFLDDVVCDRSLRAIQELNIKVPDDLGLITLSNAGRNFSFPKQLHRLEFDPVESMRLAMRLLDDQIDGKDKTGKAIHTLPEYIEGETLRKKMTF